MPEPQPRKPDLSPSPFLLVLLIVILAVLVVGAITLLSTGLKATSVQTGAVAQTAPTDGLPALRQIVDFDYGGLMEGVYVRYGDNVIIIGQRYQENATTLNSIFDLLVQNFRITK